MCSNLSNLSNVTKNVCNMMLKAVRKLNKHITTFDSLLTSTTGDNKSRTACEKTVLSLAHNHHRNGCCITTKLQHN